MVPEHKQQILSHPHTPVQNTLSKVNQEPSLNNMRKTNSGSIIINVQGSRIVLMLVETN